MLTQEGIAAILSRLNGLYHAHMGRCEHRLKPFNSYPQTPMNKSTPTPSNHLPHKHPHTTPLLNMSTYMHHKHSSSPHSSWPTLSHKQPSNSQTDPELLGQEEWRIVGVDGATGVEGLGHTLQLFPACLQPQWGNKVQSTFLGTVESCLLGLGRRLGCPSVSFYSNVGACNLLETHIRMEFILSHLT